MNLNKLKIFFMIFILVGSILFFSEGVEGGGMRDKGGGRNNENVVSGVISDTCSGGISYTYNVGTKTAVVKKGDTTRTLKQGEISTKCTMTYNIKNGKASGVKNKETNCKCAKDILEQKLAEEKNEKCKDDPRIVDRTDNCEKNAEGSNTGMYCDCVKDKWICNSNHDNCNPGGTDTSKEKTPLSSDIKAECEAQCIKNVNYANELEGSSSSEGKEKDKKSSSEGAKAFLALIKGKEILPFVDAQGEDFSSSEKSDLNYQIGLLIGKILSGKI